MNYAVYQHCSVSVLLRNDHKSHRVGLLHDNPAITNVSPKKPCLLSKQSDNLPGKVTVRVEVCQKTQANTPECSQHVTKTDPREEMLQATRHPFSKWLLSASVRRIQR